MPTCQQVYQFLTQVGARNVTSPLSDTDLGLLKQCGIVQVLTQDQYHAIETNVASLDVARAAVSDETTQRADLGSDVDDEERRTHSVLFHFESKDKQAAKLQQENQDEARLHSLDQDLSQKQMALAELVAQQSLHDTLTSCGNGYVGFTALGVVATRNLGVALYRVGDADFAAYWAQAQQIRQDLDNLAAGAAAYVPRLSLSIPSATRSYLWSISIGLAKNQPDPTQGSAAFLQEYEALAPLSGNLENRLMSAEILSARSVPLDQSIPTIRNLLAEVEQLRVPSESALGVASVIWLGQRADGTFATANLPNYLAVTPSFESAALLAIVNLPIDQLTSKFQSLRGLFSSWGYQPSEDVELSSAYLAVSELPVEGISTKLAIISKGLANYLEFPLVGAAVLASLGDLEANETLNLLGEAYDIVGRRAMGLSQPELICLAIRMLHGIRDELVRPLDATAAAVPTAVRPSGVYGPHFFYAPIIIAHNSYFSTYSGMAGAHPGHVHGFVAGGGGTVG